MTNPIKLIAIVGMPGSGKSMAAEFFRSKGIPVLRFGDQTDIGLHEMNLSLTEENERMYREKIRQELGMAAMAIKIESRINAAAQTHHLIILDGLYSWEEYMYLKGKFPEILLLCIWATPMVRYERLIIRFVRPLTHKEAEDRDKAEIEHLNKGGPIAMANYIITNETDAAAFQKKLADFYDTQKI